MHRHHTFLLTSMSTFLAIANATQASPVIAYWDFNNQSGSNVTDVSVNNRIGTLEGSATLSAGGAGHSGGANDRALVLNATNGSQMRVPIAEFDGYSPGTDSYSVSFWVKRNSATTQGGGLFDFNASTTQSFQAEIGNAGNLNFLVGSTGVGGGGTSWSQMQLPNGTISDTEWHHIVSVIDRSGPNPIFLLYVNGNLTVPTYPFTGLPPSSFGSVTFNHDLLIGQLNNGFNFQGMIDDLAIYSIALTDAQVAGLANRTLTPLDVPEPASLTLLGMGTLLMARRRRG